ncbi:MAG: bifunctional diaminohydroxyphosphoribosylaminopyrimidine deaminase/5-amino-6-(5-phosphoribosylamino)uracil reductase RibD, partial [Bacteroidales bacterium]|nr:bifunctional diaminohydroxyphosphoribosylaminopyrimidine deaminase/5-amino-6-(5-phosphoribosylamino)uracil reductase RibD [Bacteroidales bacterium]
GNVAPNPMVGCVIVHQNKIIGEGYHKKIGESHAEVNAIQSVKDKSVLSESKLYVNLEPCSHVGKTPPCTDLILEYNIPEIIVGMIDPNKIVAGKGIEKLKNNGCIVKNGISENECINLNKQYLTFIEKKRPYIILKWAQTLDGFIDLERNQNSPIEPNWITDKTARILVHKWRSEEQAIMVGTNTVEKDNPDLTNRFWAGKSPLRIVIDKNLKLNRNYNIFNNTAQTIIYNQLKDKAEKNLNFIKINFNKNIIPQILNDLYNKNVQSVIIEGGRKLLLSFIDINIWDEARVFMGPKMFKQGIKAPLISGGRTYFDTIGNSKLIYYNNTG